MSTCDDLTLHLIFWNPLRSAQVSFWPAPLHFRLRSHAPVINHCT